jgi:hypothetical protein
MRILTTNTGRELKITSNQSKRHSTIKTESGKYRTYPMSQDEFDSNELNTANDWAQFLKSDDYYRVN